MFICSLGWGLVVLTSCYYFLNSIMLLFLIVCLSLLLALMFTFYHISFLGLMWGLVYLGGMTIIFVYVTFLSQDFITKNFSFFTGKEKPFLVLSILCSAIIKYIFLIPNLNFFELKQTLYNQISSSSFQFLEWELYNQISSSSFQFIFFLIFIITFSLIFLLSMFKKHFKIQNEVSLLFYFIMTLLV